MHGWALYQSCWWPQSVRLSQASHDMQVLEVLQRASQAVKVTWMSDDQDKENKDPLPASGEHTCQA